jgi:transcriptional regulator of acetoin/glycerol metabolism
LASTEAAFEAWRAYASIGRLDPQLLREPVFRAWERCHLAGTNPRRASPEVLSRHELERLLVANETLVEGAQPYLRALSRAAGSERHAAMLGDAQAIILDVRGDEASIRGPESVPGPGSLLSEAHAGANGISTPLEDGGYVKFVGPEHFIAGFSPFTCQGTPIHGVHGGVVGSLSVSVRSAQVGDRLARLLMVATRGLEAELVVGELRERLRELRRCDTSDDEWAKLERLHQDLIQVHTASRLEFELATFEISQGNNAEALVASAHETIERFARLSRLWRILADPTEAVDDELEVGRLVRDTVDLFRTEARIAGVTLCTSAVHHGRVRRVHAAVHALVHGHWAALCQAGVGGMVEISVDERGRVRWTITRADGRQHLRHYDLSGVRS